MKNNWFNLLLFSLIVVCSFFSCRRETAPENNNMPPVAIAGNDTLIVLPQDSFALDGSESYDAEGSIGEYVWSKISGPSSFSITNSRSARAIAKNLVQGTYEFGLKVTDSAGLSAKDTITVRVVTPGTPCDMVNRSVIRARLEPLGMLSIGRIELLTAAANNKILFAGGFSYDIDGTGIPTRRIDIYDVSDHTWSTKDLPEYPTFRTDMGIASNGGKIFIAGGGFWGDDLYTNEVDIYNSSDNSWSKAGLSEGRTALTGVSSNNKVFFAGGYAFNNGSNYWSKTVDIYDNETDKWTKATLSQAGEYLSAVAAGNKVYFAGGVKNDGQVGMSDRIDEYDMITDSWSTSKLQEARSGMAAIAAGNKVFWAGGWRSNSGLSGTVEIQDVVTGVISFACIIPRAGLRAVLKDDKIIFFTGGNGADSDGTRFEIYNLTTDTWYTGVMDKSIIGAAIISVNNIVYVAGGYVNGVGSDQVWTLEF